MIERNLFKILLTACFAVLLAPLAKAQEGKWQAASAFEYWVDHLPYNTFEHVDELDPLVFCASQDNLLIIDGSTDEFSLDIHASTDFREPTSLPCAPILPRKPSGLVMPTAA
jgi:hypothetical protein